HGGGDRDPPAPTPDDACGSEDADDEQGRGHDEDDRAGGDPSRRGGGSREQAVSVAVVRRTDESAHADEDGGPGEGVGRDAPVGRRARLLGGLGPGGGL